MRRPLLAAVGAVALVVGASSCSTFDPNAASVNGEEIKRRDFEDDLHELRENEEYVTASQQAVDGPLANSVATDFAARELTNRILASLIHDELVARRLTVDPAVADAAREIAPEAALPQTADPATTFEQLPAGYQAQVETELGERLTLALALNDTSLPELEDAVEGGGVRFGLQVCARAIPVATEEEARAALDELASGADYGTVVANYSIDPSLAQTEGQLLLQDGSCPSGQQLLQLGDEFVDALDAAEIGEDVGPIALQDIFVIGRVDSIEGTDPSAIQQQLASILSPQNEAFATWLTDTVNAADIDVDPRYGRWDAVTSSVVSPANDTPTTLAT